MIEADTRKAIYLLHQEGMTYREISGRLGVSRTIWLHGVWGQLLLRAWQSA